MTRRVPWHRAPWLYGALALLAGVCALAPAGRAAEAPRRTLVERVTPEVLAAVAPGAERLGDAATLAPGRPPALPFYKGGEIAGYVFSTLDVIAATGYSGVPFDVIAGIDASGAITGAALLFHAEPIVEGRRLTQLRDFLARHAGYRLVGPNPGAPPPDFVAGASISAGAMRAAILDAGDIVFHQYLGRPRVTEPTLDRERFRLASLAELVAGGSVARRVWTAGELPSLAGAPGDAGARLVDIYVAPLAPATIGRNLLGRRAYANALEALPPGGQALLVGSDGTFNLLGDAAFRPLDDATLGRLRLVQGGRSIGFDAAHAERVGTSGGEGIRVLKQAALLALDAAAGFDPLLPFRLEATLPGRGGATVALAVEYRLPEEHILRPEPPRPPAWLGTWQGQRWDVAILGLGLAALTAILLLQRQLARRRRLHRALRTSFLACTLLWLGWTAGGQLSIVHLVNYLQAPFRGLGWGFYLAEPLIVVVTLYTLASLVLIGRGVFCGWLCPFGALQELSNLAARALGVPQWAPGEALSRRLKLGKYASAALVLGLSFVSLDAALGAAEIEPFKTAIAAGFARPAPYVAYAALLLLFGLVTERFYCRFLCPLGGALALLGRVHLLRPLLRRAECGRPCRACERACPVKAIDRAGRIDLAECFQCLDCQVLYFDGERCPPLVQARRPIAA